MGDRRKRGRPAGTAGWYATVNEVGKFLEGIRTHKVLSQEPTKMMLKQSLGWDASEPGWTKGGLLANGAGQILACRASLFPAGVAAVLFVNAPDPTPTDVIATGWLLDRGR